MAELRARDVDVSPYQLERWRAAGLLAHPRRRGGGRGRGSTSAYPPEALEAVLGITTVARQGRNNHLAALALFAKKLPVTEKAVRDAFIWVIDRADARVRAAGGDGEDPAGTAGERARAWVGRHDPALIAYGLPGTGSRQQAHQRRARLDSLRDAAASSVFALVEDPAQLHPSYLIDMARAMGATELADNLNRAFIVADLAGEEWRLPNAYDNARETLERSSWSQLCDSRDIALLCGRMNVVLQVQAIIDEEARSLLRSIETDPRWFALHTLAFVPVAGRLREVVWSTLLVASDPTTRQGAEAYAEWLRPQLMRLLRASVGPASLVATPP